MSETNWETTPLQVIGQKTSERHKRLESLMEDRFFDPSEDSDQQFLALLERLYGLYDPQEEVLIPAVQQHLDQYPYEPRRERLASDLRTLGHDDEDLAALPRVSEPSLVEPDGLAETIGCLYVIEGAELGGSVLRRHFEDVLTENSLLANAYYRDRPEETREQWSAFRARFNDRIRTDDDLASAVRIAQKMFDLYEQWMT